MNDILLVFAKVPRPGDVKTRLTPFLTPREAARLYDAFLRDALALYARLEANTRLYLAPPLPDDGLGDVPDRISVHEQRGEGLGPRMAHAFEAAFRDGGDRVAVVGTDHPTLPLSHLRQGFEALDGEPAVCIGPSEDGGFYLLGMSAFYPQLFADMTYSHGDVFTDTLARIGATDAELTVLPQWYDVDTPEALARMIADLRETDVDAPRTRRAVERLALDDLVDSENR
ncbi:MAG: TIGR04282 family arsenosugar biosynthesis glycosyltransferase [Salinivenus sp.]